MAKSFGKIILFRIEDLQDLDKNLRDVMDKNTGLPINNWLVGDREEILRSMTFRYVNNNGILENKPIHYKSLTKVKLPANDEMADTHVRFLTDLDGTQQAPKHINFNPHTGGPSGNKKGLFPSPYPFVNHNAVVSRPLITTKNSSEEANPASYGLDDQITVTPVYNFYLKEYERFFDHNHPGFKKAIDAQYLQLEKAIPNFYESIFFLSYFQEGGKGKPSSYITPEKATSSEFSSLSSFLNSTARILKNFSPEGGYYGNTKKFFYYFYDEQHPKKERNSVVVLTPDFYKTHNSFIETQKNVYPFYNKITIPVTKEGTALREFFKWANAYDDLIFTMGASIKAMRKVQRDGTDEQKEKIEQLKKRYNIHRLTAKPGEEDIFTTEQVTDPETGELMYNDDGTPQTKEVFSHTNKLLTSKWESEYIAKIYEFPFLRPTEEYDQDWSAAMPLITWSSDNWDQDLNDYEIPYINTKGRFDTSTSSDHPDNWNDIVRPLDQKSKSFVVKGVLPLLLYGIEAGNDKSVSNAKKINNTLMFKKLANVVKLSAKRVLENKENYSETLYYEIAKYSSIEDAMADGPPIQTFIIPNDPDLDTVEYIDSQIRYGAPYFYKVYAHVMSMGNKMRRDKLSMFAQYWNYDNEYDARILRVPYYNTRKLSSDSDFSGYKLQPTFNLDSPPMPPNINFFPYKNVSDKIGFWFNVQMGEAMMVPDLSLLNPLQYNNLTMFAAMKGLEITSHSDNPPMLYKTDDYGGKFEIFRITKRPEKYTDFKDAGIATVDVIGAKTFIDKIQPNQDYYYTFRSVDVHDLPSNPTPVYHFKMITHNDVPEADSVHIGTSGDQPVLFNEIIYLNDNYKEKIDNKSFKKYLLIEPSLRQTFLDFGKSGFLQPQDQDMSIESSQQVLTKSEQLEFGNSDVKLFGKKFKLRLTSKQTGRKLDINVDFKSPDIYKKEEED